MQKITLTELDTKVSKIEITLFETCYKRITIDTLNNWRVYYNGEKILQSSAKVTALNRYNELEQQE